MFGKLYIVATPIGNLADMSSRAIEVLQQVDLIAAEDTRHTRPLLQYFKIETPCIAYHDHNEKTQSQQLVARLHKGQSVALVSDAGTPLISDPGYSLVHAAIENQITVVPIPGSCAMVTALSASGLPTDKFFFAGFLSAKSGARSKQLESLKELSCTLIFYESKHRIIDSLASMAEVFGRERQCVVARELTKKFESFYHGNLIEVSQVLQETTEAQKGEFVVMVHGLPSHRDDDISPEALRVLSILNNELPPKQAAKLAAQITGLNKNKLYQASLG